MARSPDRIPVLHGVHCSFLWPYPLPHCESQLIFSTQRETAEPSSWTLTAGTGGVWTPRLVGCGKRGTGRGLWSKELVHTKDVFVWLRRLNDSTTKSSFPSDAHD
jgi:hypothetical protein